MSSDPAPSFAYVPQRSAAKQAEAKMKEARAIGLPRQSTSSSPARDSKSRSPPPLKSASMSRTTSSSASQPSVRKQASTTHKPRPRAGANGSEPSMPSGSDVDSDTAPLSTKPSSVESDYDSDLPKPPGRRRSSSGHSERHMPASKQKSESVRRKSSVAKVPVVKPEPLVEVMQPIVEPEPMTVKPEPSTAVELGVSSTSVRSKRTAAQAATNSIQRAYTELVADDAPQPEQPLVEPELFATTEPAPSSPPVRSKRSAAQAAFDNIQRAYTEFAGEDEQQSSALPKRPRTSNPKNAKPKRREEDKDFAGPSAPGASRSRPSTSRAVAAPISRPNLVPQRYQDVEGVTWEVQLGACKNQKYERYRKCVQCIAKKVGDTCRFAGFRAFAVDPSTNNLYPFDPHQGPGPAFISSPDPDAIMNFPPHTRIPTADLLEAQSIVARSLLPVLEAELVHAHLPSVLRRPRESEHRQMCEFCSTSIFSASWFCRCCGKEYCPDCMLAFDQPPNPDPVLAKRLSFCSTARQHTSADLMPLTRFDVLLLEREVDAMRVIRDGYHVAQRSTAESRPGRISPRKMSLERESRLIKICKDLPQEQVGLHADRIVGSHSMRTFDAVSFDTDVFRREWAYGEPLLVRDVIGPMQDTWDPDALRDRYGHEYCHIARADTYPELVKAVSVGEFFSTFGKDAVAKEEALGVGSWKLKDWPPSAEFKTEFPELYADFNRAVPAPEYTTREGVMNLGSCYPKGVIQPDLGPKMYNAWPASEGVGGGGTTRLHMDMADAVNIMLYASPPTGDDVPDEHKPGVAAWDIFRAEDADSLRAFLRQEHADLNLQDDPIHHQRFFISAPQRVKLWEEYGVRSWRIYQKAGEAVFIPAGCAHQVCNLADCIKVAVDFVSPQNVERCFKLTAEFRELVKDYKKAWKEDVLSLRTTLWYAWCTYRQMSGVGPNAWTREQQEKLKKEREQSEGEGEGGGEKLTRIARMILQDA